MTVTVAIMPDGNLSPIKPLTKDTIAPKMFNDAKEHVRKCPQCQKVCFRLQQAER